MATNQSNQTFSESCVICGVIDFQRNLKMRIRVQLNQPCGKLCSTLIDLFGLRGYKRKRCIYWQIIMCTLPISDWRTHPSVWLVLGKTAFGINVIVPACLRPATRYRVLRVECECLGLILTRGRCGLETSHIELL